MERWWAFAAVAACPIACSLVLDDAGLTGGRPDTLDGTTLDDARSGSDAPFGDAMSEDGAPSDAAASDAETDGLACPPDAAFANDPLHCGACGHSCFGGPCISGVCQPAQVATGQAKVHWMAMSANNLFWTDRASIRSSSKSGGTVMNVVTGRTDVVELATGAGRVFWTECTDYVIGKGGVYSCAETGCAGAPTEHRSDACYTAIGFDDSSGLLYFGSLEPYFEIRRCDPSTCISTTSLIANARYANPASLTLAGGEVFWVETMSGLWTCANPGCAPPGARKIATAPTKCIAAPSIVDGVAYFTSYGSGGADSFMPAAVGSIDSNFGGVYRASLGHDGGAPDTISAGGSATAVIADQSAIRFTNAAGGVIFSCPRGGCDGGATRLAIGQGHPYAMVQDATSIYWANYADGRVMRLAK